MEEFESSAEFQALVVAATEKPERSMGDSVIPAEPPQWNQVRSLALELIKSAGNQLAVHVYLIQAEANVNGFTGLQKSMQTALALVQDQWDDIYPEPDLDDPDDMYYARVNLVNELSEQPIFLERIHRLPLVSVRGIGEFSARDIDICAGVLSGTDAERARCQEGLIRGAFAESDRVELRRIADALEALPGLCHSFESVFTEKTGQRDVLSLNRLSARLEACRDRFREYAGEHLAAPEESAEPPAESPETSDSQSVELAGELKHEPVQASSLASRAMVMESFDAILRYYEQHEPSSPVRVLTFRTRDFVDKPFFELLQSLAPAYRDDFPGMLAQLQQQPLAAILSDCYSRYLAGEALPTLGPAEASAVTHGTDSEPATAASEVDAHSAESLQISVSPVTASADKHAALVVDSRQQVLEALHDIETYFVNAEPASPIPLVISDIRKLVTKRFEELVAEFSRLLPVASVEAGE